MSFRHGDLLRYICDMTAIQSHLEGARSHSVGLYNHNPHTHQIPDMDDLMTRLNLLIEEVNGAANMARLRLGEYNKSEQL